MKLRLRSLQSKETLKIEVPDSCTLQQLKEILSHSLFSSVAAASSSSSSSAIRFSLNKKDELNASSPLDLLQSLGITSGDLIYYSLNPNDFSTSSPETLGSSSCSFVQQGNNNNNNNNNPHQSLNFQESEILVPKQQDALVQNLPAQGHTDVHASDVKFQVPTSKESEVLGLNGPNAETQESDDKNEIVGSDMNDTGIEEQRSLMSNAQMGETLETQELAGVEGMDIDVGSVDTAGNRFTEPYFLRRVLKEEFGGDDGTEHKLLVIAIHAVFLESGFVGFDSVSGMRVDRFHLADEWPSKVFQVSLWYTLPELLENDNGIESVVLKFQILGHFVNIYGSLAKGGSPLGPYRVCLNECRFAPSLNLVWANSDKNDKINENDGLSMSYLENEVFEFWKIVKDGLALPLLIDLCEKTGLVLPSCLMRLPAELKFKILESLPGVDIARMGSVCSEMRYLSSNNDLWKQKFEEVFGSGMRAQEGINWKDRFASAWESNKKRKRLEISAQRGVPKLFMSYDFPIRRDPDPLAFPSLMIGGDYDRMPGLGVPFPFGRAGQAFPRFHMRRNFSPNCNLGGFNA